MAECLETVSLVVVSSYDAVMDTPIPGIKLGVQWHSGMVYGMDFLPAAVADKGAKDKQLAATMDVLGDYFSNGYSPATLAIHLAGTDFQLRVWQAIQQIPPGAVATYAELAHHLGSAPRAIGGACRRNPIPIIVPCHRVVASNGIGGFAGAVMGKHIDIKQWLLDHERGSLCR